MTRYMPNYILCLQATRDKSTKKTYSSCSIILDTIYCHIINLFPIDLFIKMRKIGFGNTLKIFSRNLKNRKASQHSLSIDFQSLKITSLREWYVV